MDRIRKKKLEHCKFARDREEEEEEEKMGLCLLGVSSLQQGAT